MKLLRQKIYSKKFPTYRESKAIINKLIKNPESEEAAEEVIGHLRSLNSDISMNDGIRKFVRNNSNLSKEYYSEMGYESCPTSTNISKRMAGQLGCAPHEIDETLYNHIDSITKGKLSDREIYEEVKARRRQWRQAAMNRLHRLGVEKPIEEEAIGEAVRSSKPERPVVTNSILANGKHLTSWG